MDDPTLVQRSTFITVRQNSALAALAERLQQAGHRYTKNDLVRAAIRDLLKSHGFEIDDDGFEKQLDTDIKALA